jgi:multicomponent K+:H+ antiporter subunit D
VLVAPAAVLLAASPLLVAFGGGVTRYTEATARQVMEPAMYVEAVLTQRPASPKRPPAPPGLVD